MQTIRSIVRLLLVCSTVNGLITGCNPKTDSNLAPPGNCQIQRMVSTSKAGDTNGTTETVYEYDGGGNVLKKTTTSESTSISYVSGNVSDKTTTVETYSYNADGFLTNSTNSILQHLNFFGKQSEYHLETTKTYTYANDRLTGYTQSDVVFDSNVTRVPQPRTTVTTSSYEYDGSGQLLKQTTSNGDSWTYRNGQVIAYTGANPLSLQDGLIIKGSFPGTNSTGAPLTLVQVNQYDDQRRLVKHEEFLNDTLNTYFTQEWQAGKAPDATLPAFKGHPLIQSPYGEQGLLTKYRAYNANFQHVLNQYFESTYTHQLNAEGLVTNTKLESQFLYSGQKQANVTTTVYTYTGCQ